MTFSFRYRYLFLDLIIKGGCGFAGYDWVLTLPEAGSNLVAVIFLIYEESVEYIIY